MPEVQEEIWLKQMVQVYGNDVLRTCWFLLRDRYLAEDATQDTFEKIWKNRTHIQKGDPSTEKALILKIAMNASRDLIRSSWWKHVDRKQDVDQLEQIPDESDSDYTRSDLMMDIMNLPYQLRQVILLYHFHHMTMTEVAESIGISQPAVTKRLKKAYRLLKCGEEE